MSPRCWRELVYAEIFGFAHIGRQPAALALESKCIAKATLIADLARVQRRRVAVLPCAASGPLKSQQSAQTPATEITPKNVAEQVAASQAALHNIGLADTHNAAPEAQFSACASARQQGTDVITLLQEKKRQLLSEPVHRYAASIATALRSWHQLAVSVIGHLTSTTLPPHSAMHAVSYLPMFALAMGA